MLSEQVQLEMHHQMVRIRRFEETLQQVYMEGKSPAFDIAAGPVPGEMHLPARSRWPRESASTCGRATP